MHTGNKALYCNGKAVFKSEKLFSTQIEPNFSETTELQPVIFMVLKITHFRTQIKSKWKALKCAAARGRRSSVFF